MGPSELALKTFVALEEIEYNKVENCFIFYLRLRLHLPFDLYLTIIPPTHVMTKESLAYGTELYKSVKSSRNVSAFLRSAPVPQLD